jgi:hypothetical protein
MRQAGEEQDDRLRFPWVLPAFDKPESLCSLAKGRCNQGAAVIRIRPRRGLQVEHRGEQAGIGVAALLLRGAHHPLARGPTEAMGAQDCGALAAWTRRGWPRAEVRTHRVHAAALADCGHHLRAATQEPMENFGGPKAAVHAEHNRCPTVAAPAQRGCNL